jgi:tetratricopeptide (TPR) repeat protein
VTVVFGGSRHLAAAWKLYEVGRYPQVLAETQKALGEEPQSVEAHRLRALALIMLGRHGPAQQAIRQALALDPESEFSHRVNAINFLEAGELPSARKAIGEALRLSPRSVEAFSLIAEIELRRGAAEKAREAALSALKIDPNHRPSLVRAAHAASRTNRLKAAEEFALRAVALDPTSASAHRALGTVAFAAGDRETARATFREALRLDPNDEWTRNDLLQTLRAKSPVYRAMLGLVNWFRRRGVQSTRWAGFIVWVASRGLMQAGFGVHSDVAAIALFGVVLFVPLLIHPLHDLIVWRDSFGRMLLRGCEKFAAAATTVLLVVALALLGARFALHSDLIGWAAAGSYALAGFSALFRRARSRAALVRLGVVGAILAGVLVAALVAGARHDREPAKGLSAVFVAALFVALVTQKYLLGGFRPKARRAAK